MPFVWHELRVPDLEEAVRFYGAVFAWSFPDNPMGKTITHRGVVIGGASAVKVGLDTHWTPYIACADVDAAAARAAAAGGVVTTGQPADVPGIGRIAPILDPEKSIFVAFAPLAGGAAPPHEPGRFVWERLRTADVAGAAAFYAATFGWGVTVGDGGAVVDADGLRVAELVPDAAATGWLPFVRVADLAEACDRVVALGGAAEEPVRWQGTAGYAVVRDPQGVAFAVHAE
jgi:uncharacterized protein